MPAFGAQPHTAPGVVVRFHALEGPSGTSTGPVRRARPADADRNRPARRGRPGRHPMVGARRSDKPRGSTTSTGGQGRGWGAISNLRPSRSAARWFGPTATPSGVAALAGHRGSRARPVRLGRPVCSRQASCANVSEGPRGRLAASRPRRPRSTPTAGIDEMAAIRGQRSKVVVFDRPTTHFQTDSPVRDLRAERGDSNSRVLTRRDSTRAERGSSGRSPTLSHPGGADEAQRQSRSHEPQRTSTNAAST
jgi:hypothetical protein